MVWLTWRQHRMQVLATGALLALAAVLLLANALPGDVVKMLPFSPVLIGLFWGVPLLVKEYERGTHKVVWTQTVTRRRWMLVKFGMLGVAVSLAGLAVGAVVSVWLTQDHENPYLNRFSGDMFGQTGVAPVGWFLFLFAIGAAAGSVLRRTLPAMAVTIAVFIGVIFAIPVVRENYAEPELAVQEAVSPEDVIVEQGWMNAAGATVTDNEVFDLCAGNSDLVACVTDMGYDRGYTAYHPASRYWQFQWTETALLVLVAVALAGFTAVRTIRRV